MDETVSPHPPYELSDREKRIRSAMAELDFKRALYLQGELPHKEFIAARSALLKEIEGDNHGA